MEQDLASTASTTDKKRQRTPRYLQLAGELREAILQGEFSGGKQFPTETALCARYDVSRFTVREALRRLEAEGLIQRRRGSGTTVQPAAARGGALHQPLSNVGELLQYARDSEVRYEEVASGALPDRVAEQIGVPVTGEWMCFRGTRRHSEDALPIAVTDAYFHEYLGEAPRELDLSAGTLFSQIERLAGVRIGKVTQDIQAIPADAATASALGIDEASPVLRILRCYFDPDGRLFEISVSHHPGDRFAYAMHIDVEG
ncbi:transcriptional regulator, GntR family [Erythrobacter sp. HL-111]|nr:MAG: GntR family transcriptional regulator [Erythrobacteraceae bacterium HL-111]SDS90444.1 transcriptional regulator, GntR family [Erythrobacter sp. HL-111]